jgi:MYXO-CTERM domain-containing protein
VEARWRSSACRTDLKSPGVPGILALLAALVVLVAARRRRRDRLPAQSVIVSSPRATVIEQDGAVRSVQSAELILSRAALERLWSGENLENLARTYWRFLSRVTLGLIRVVYGPEERRVVLLFRPLSLLRFEAPEYTLEPGHGKVSWRIRDGLLVARRGRGCGVLALDVRRLDDGNGSELTTLRIEVEVANFYPAIAAGFSTPVYEATQSSIHVLVTHAFLRSLAKLRLAQSKVGRLRALRSAVPYSRSRGAGQP